MPMILKRKKKIEKKFDNLHYARVIYNISRRKPRPLENPGRFLGTPGDECVLARSFPGFSFSLMFFRGLVFNILLDRFQ